MHNSAKVIVIAEAGVNHNGQLETALELVRAAAKTGADIVKFQHFRTEELTSSQAPAAAYQKTNTGVSSQADLLRALELDLEDFEIIAAESRKAGIAFLCTAFDVDAAKSLVGLGMDCVKIPSGELTNTPMLSLYARFGLPVLLSTGMATLAEVKAAVNTLRQAGAPKISVLQCTSLYPAPPGNMNLRAMVTMGRECNLDYGLSDHSLDDHASIAAVALGATVIEKHFTLDRNLPGPDHRASLEPGAFAEMVQRIRDIEVMLGDGRKEPSEAELETAKLVRRSWHTKRQLAAGSVIGASDVVLKRPAAGLPPATAIVGARVKTDLQSDFPIGPEHVDLEGHKA